MKTYLQIQDKGFREVLAKIEDSEEKIELWMVAHAHQDPAERTPGEITEMSTVEELSSFLHYLLISTTEGQASGLIRQLAGTPFGDNGFEIWRMLYLRYKPPDGRRDFSRLTTIMNPQFRAMSFEEEFSKWESLMARYVADTKGDEIPDRIKLALLVSRTTGVLKQHLQLNSGSIVTFDAARKVALEFTRSSSAKWESDAMEVDATMKGGKGKGFRGKEFKGYDGRFDGK